MNKYLITICLALLFTTPPAFALNFKLEACKSSCKEALQSCQEKNQGKELKLTACKATKKQCTKKCKKKFK